METLKDRDTLTSDLKKPVGLTKVFISVIILSLVFGLIGGLAGALYLPHLTALKKFFPSVGNLEQSIQPIQLKEDSVVVDVVKSARPAVVSVIISKDLSKLQSSANGPFGFDPFGQFFGFGSGQTNQQQPQTPNVQQIGAGSGFFVTADGLILTNKHVVADETASYSVVTNDGKTYDAKVLARDPVNDLAILKIDITGAQTLSLADSGALELGQKVIAIGNSLGQYQNTVTTGVVSGIGRSITAGGDTGGSEQLEGVIQTDAAINPGNSGGPLLNSLGQVIGINTAIDQQGQLVGFSIPSNDAKKALESFQKNGNIVRPFLGVRYVIINKAMAADQKLPKDYGALLVRGQTVTDFAVSPGSPADKAGLQENDIILEVNGQQVTEDNSLVKILKNFNPGDTLSLKIYHKGSEKTVSVTLTQNK